MKLLIVDDNPIMRKTLRTFLTEENDTVFECIDGSEVLSVYSKELPHYVFMDIDMPIMNGLEATKQLVTEYPEARVIFITSHDERQFREAAMKAGAVAYYLKENIKNVREYIYRNRVGYL